MKFEVFLCHGADPASKGKPENVVKYARHSFAEHRIFTDIESLNAYMVAQSELEYSLNRLNWKKQFGRGEFYQ